MVTVHRAFGFRFAIFSNDHEPAHIHVFGKGGEVKIDLAQPGSVELVWTVAVSRSDVRKILQEAEAKREDFLQAWRCIHG